MTGQTFTAICLLLTAAFLFGLNVWDLVRVRKPKEEGEE